MWPAGARIRSAASPVSSCGVFFSSYSLSLSQNCDDGFLLLSLDVERGERLARQAAAPWIQIL
jgi:hypothetical protein